MRGSFFETFGLSVYVQSDVGVLLNPFNTNLHCSRADTHFCLRAVLVVAFLVDTPIIQGL
jgi:hypothetical protein